MWASKRLKHLEPNAPARVEDRRCNTNLMGREKCMFYVCLRRFTPRVNLFLYAHNVRVYTDTVEIKQPSGLRFGTLVEGFR